MEIKKSNFGNTDFHILISNNNSENFFEKMSRIDLVKSNFFLNAIDAIKNSLLHKACYHNNFEIVSFLIENGHDVNCQNSNGQTPLHIAYMNNFEKIIELLLESGASESIKDINKFTPIETKL